LISFPLAGLFVSLAPRRKLLRPRSLICSAAGWTTGKEINIRGAATWFGPMNLRVVSYGVRMDIKLEPPARNPPRQIRLHLRRPEYIQQVLVNGRVATAAELEAGVGCFVNRDADIIGTPWE